MPEVNTHACSVCGMQRGDRRDWFVIFVAGPAFTTLTWSIAEHEGMVQSEHAEHICGEGCCAKRYSTWFGDPMGARFDANDPPEQKTTKTTEGEKQQCKQVIQ